MEVCIAKYGSLEAAREFVERRQEARFAKSLGLASVPEAKPKAKASSKRKSKAKKDPDRRSTDNNDDANSPTTELELGHIASIPKNFWCALAETTSETLHLDFRKRARKTSNRGAKTKRKPSYSMNE